MDDIQPPSSAQDDARWDHWFEIQIRQVWDDRQSSADSFDKSMMTLSSGALGVSLAFIKDIVPLERALWLNLLRVSWLAFAICIVITVLSFRASTIALKKHEDLLRKAYAQRKVPEPEDYWLLKVCTRGAILFFLVGLACTMLFVEKNVSSFHTGERFPAGVHASGGGILHE
jgi:hypothetical protein